jgi:hypothetical protein
MSNVHVEAPSQAIAEPVQELVGNHVGGHVEVDARIGERHALSTGTGTEGGECEEHFHDPRFCRVRAASLGRDIDGLAGVPAARALGR